MKWSAHSISIGNIPNYSFQYNHCEKTTDTSRMGRILEKSKMPSKEKLETVDKNNNVSSRFFHNASWKISFTRKRVGLYMEFF